MNRLWKWLLHSDARAPFFIALACFLAVCAWLALQEVSRSRRERAEAAAEEAAARNHKPPELAPVEGIGLLDYVEEQLSPDTLIIPVNPFHPTFEALVLSDGLDHSTGRPMSREEWRERQRERREREGGGQRWPQRPGGGGGASGGDGWDDPRAQPAGGQPGGAQPKPKQYLSYNGFMQRADGRFAPLFHDSSDKSNHFAVPGGEVHGVKILGAGKDGALVLTADGAFHDLKLGDRVELPEQ